MKIVWDEHKRKSNLSKHGLDFASFSLDMLENAYYEQSYLGRIKAIFRLEDNILAVIFAALGKEALSIISFRPASKNERNKLQ
jgi:uncharacterized protein